MTIDNVLTALLNQPDAAIDDEIAEICMACLKHVESHYQQFGQELGPTDHPRLNFKAPGQLTVTCEYQALADESQREESIVITQINEIKCHSQLFVQLR